ncbi:MULTISPECIES: tryptophan synthase subunit beta like protein [unclassified Modicisalibacter]|uniref:tryptophan synthase subunit beta like protein n=1 Tax=unclassified Modicisalibacter TaxID=2679913 RepID=UPI001CCA4758|nr:MULTISPECIES: tryptophan synthase subunit beta like protein [unclassified Modicisalibacter]MBZ9560444.1 tryptophan synthase subunit beta like protein [Modicisalibacter sp. R2A 31.J]MBZ9576353.1 tryptophan synthase subunit beta like protein [Modicisalibacter sp. MOD 31.J]
MYIKRSANGEIELASRYATPDCTEYLPADAQEWGTFLDDGTTLHDQRWQQRDREFIRVLEDLLEVLVNDELLCLEDLPMAAREKLAGRRLVRYQHQIEKAAIESGFEASH